jgi:hypothetical protein
MPVAGGACLPAPFRTSSVIRRESACKSVTKRTPHHSRSGVRDAAAIQPDQTAVRLDQRARIEDHPSRSVDVSHHVHRKELFL